MDPGLHRKVVAEAPPALPCSNGLFPLASEVTMPRRIFLFFTLFLTSASLFAQTGFTARWEQRTTQTQSRQPAWPPPLVTTYVGLIQVYRADFLRQTASNHVQTWNLDGGKGLNLIPFANTELDLNLPPYLKHSAPTTVDGAGDLSFLLKYRFLAGNAHHGSYAVSAFLPATLPTGSHKNGSADATIAPSVGLGKGFGLFDVQSTLGATLPVRDTATLGRSIAWNTAAQLHVAKSFWPEVEFNSTYYKGGPNDGKNQTFATPGLLVAHKLRPSDERSRLGLCMGAGEQIATSRFHAYNHGIAVTTRLLF